MAKDPAFLFYPNDWLGGTMGLTRHQKGCYIELLVAQFNCGPLSMEAIKNVLGQDQACWTVLSSKFKKDSEGNYFNERLESERVKRRKHSEHQSKNARKRWDKPGICDGIALAMPLENENRNSIKTPVGIEKVKECARKAWEDQGWREAFCMGNSVSTEDLKLWMAKFNASVCNDVIHDFNEGSYKKMLGGWISRQKSNGHSVSKVENKTNLRTL